MIGLSCDYCRKFAPMQLIQSMFGTNQVTPGGWITLQQEKPQQVSSAFLSTVFSTTEPESPQWPLNFCTPECARDYLRAKTQINGSGAA